MFCQLYFPTFSFLYHNLSLVKRLKKHYLKGIDYIGEILKEESSFAEQTFVIFMNNLEIDADGSVINYKYNQVYKSLFNKVYYIQVP